MHVAYLIDCLGSGGAQRQAVEIAVWLRREAGVRVSFAVYRDEDFFRGRLESAGIPIVRLRRRGPADPAFPRRIRAWVASASPTVVHAFLPAPSVWAALSRPRRRGPRPIWIAGERSAPEEIGWAWSHAIRWAYGRVDAVTANSRPAVETLVSEFGLDRSRVAYLPNGIDLAAWDESAAAEPPVDLEPGCFHLALVGRFSEEKNHRLLVDALSRIDPGLRAPLRVWFLGAEDAGSPYLRELRAEIERNGLAGLIRMFPPTPTLAALMRRLDALVLPSRFEGSPNVVLEAMASCLPVLASAVGDVPSLLEDGRTGWVVPAQDAAALAEGLEKLLRMTPEARAAMGSAARETVEARYRIETVARAHLDLYRRLIDGRAAGEGARSSGQPTAP